MGRKHHTGATMKEPHNMNEQDQNPHDWDVITALVIDASILALCAVAVSAFVFAGLKYFFLSA